MSAHVILNLLNKLGKEIKCEACQAFNLFFAMSLINLINRRMNVRFYLSYDLKATLKSHFYANTLRFCQIYGTLLRQSIHLKLPRSVNH